MSNSESMNIYKQIWKTTDSLHLSVELGYNLNKDIDYLLNLIVQYGDAKYREGVLDSAADTVLEDEWDE